MRVYDNGTYRDMTQEEIDEMNKPKPAQEPSLEDKVKSLEDENNILKECILEMSQVVYA